VLVVGDGSAELYDPATGTFTLAGNMIEQASCLSATLLTNGNVLITTSLPESELYDPSTGTFSLTGKFDVTDGAFPEDFAAILLPNGKVLFVGEPRAELYDPVSGTFSLTGAMTPLVDDIWGLTATLLRNGKVLVTGGLTCDFVVQGADLYDPTTGTFTATGDMTIGRDFHAATLLPDGRVLITGGAGTAASAEVYVPSTGTFHSIGDMNIGREFHTATLLNNGEVLVTGGSNPDRGILASAELYSPPPVVDFSLLPSPGALTASRGDIVTLTLNVDRTGGFSDPVTVTPPDSTGTGIRIKPRASVTGDMVPFTLKIKGKAPLGTQQLTFKAQNPAGVTRTAVVSVTIQ
jgi:hypothetical protein